MKGIRKIKDGRRIVALSSILICTILAISIFWINAHAELTPVDSITIESEKIAPNTYLPGGVEYNNGAWKVTESAKWIDYGKAKVTISFDTNKKFKTDSRDIIIAIDNGIGLTDEMLIELKEALKKFVKDHLKKDNQKIAFVYFNDIGERVITDFSNNETELLNTINGINKEVITSITSLMLEIEDIMSDYERVDDKSVTAVLISPGFISTTEDISVCNSIYKYLKNNYSYFEMNGVQLFESYHKQYSQENMLQVTDNNYIAWPIIYEKKIYEAASTLQKYSEFVITDFIDTNYFEIDEDSVEKIAGDVTVSSDKLIWNLDNTISGDFSSLTFTISLKDELLNQGGIYPINNKTHITSKIYGNEDEDVTSNKTPIIADNYKVYYDSNAPSDCTVTGAPDTQNVSVLKNYKIDDSIPTCNGYQFNGWKIITEGITKLNDEYFIMPEADVTLRAEWKKLSINKSMDGTVNGAQSLYDIMKANSVKDNVASEFVKLTVNNKVQIDYQTMSSDKNGKGIYEYTPTSNNTYPVYFYRGDVNNNYVKFADTCWRAVLTTSTGGVKLIYSSSINGDGTCPENSTNYLPNMPFNSHTVTSTSGGIGYGGYMFGIPYNTTTMDNMRPARSTSQNYGKGESGVVRDLVYSFSNAAYAISSSNGRGVMDRSTSGFAAYHQYGTNISYSNGTYTVLNTEELNFSEPDQIQGKYACATWGATQCSEVYYIINSSTNPYAFKLTDGKVLSDYYDIKIALSDSISKNGDNYVLNNPQYVYIREWFNNYNNYINKYTCGNDSTSCTDPQLILTSLVSGYNYLLNSENIQYAKNVEYSNGKYHLVDTVSFSDIILSNKNNNKSNMLMDHKYTCFDNIDTCNYVYYLMDGSLYGGSLSSAKYLILNDGSNVEQAVNNMNMNNNTTPIKSALEGIYSSIYDAYSNYIEDTVYCNDRRLSQYSSLITHNKTYFAGYYGEGGGYFAGGSRGWYEYYDYINYYLDNGSTGEDRLNNAHIDLTCNTNDAFTVSSSIGNGKLTKPVGLLTLDEFILAGGTFYHGLGSNYDHYYSDGYNSKLYLDNGLKWWTMTPYTYGLTTKIAYVNGKEADQENDNNFQIGVRPVISIKHDVPINGGDGTSANPYEFKLN